MSVPTPAAVPPPPAPPAGRPRPSHRLLRLSDLSFAAACATAALSVPLLALMLVYALARDSWLALRTFGLHFFVTNDWDPPKEVFGAVPFVYGTLVTSALAMLIAVPISVAAATYLAEIAPPWLRRGASFLIELLAAIPSVVYGFWGIFFLVPVLQGVFTALHIPNSMGRGIFTASVILAVMIVPYIAAITYDVCRAVPQSQRQGSLALGSTRWQMIWRVVLPYARPGIVGASFLALGRALGETMAVAMLIGNSPQVRLNIFELGATIPSVIANELATASTDLHRSALVELGLVLFLVTVVVNCLARLLLWRFGQGAPPAGRPLWHRLFGGGAVSPAPATADAGETIRGVAAAHRGGTLLTDRAMRWVLGACLVLTLVPLFHIFGYISLRGARSINLAFFTNLPNDDVPGLGHSIYGSAVMVGLATLGAVPLGILAALFLTEYRTSRLVPVVRFVGELLGGVPSVVVGIFAYALLVRPMHSFSGWAGAFALAVLMVPVVMRSAEEALKLVPATLRHASYALGASHAQTVLRVQLPTALPTIITGVFLAIARIAGETAPLLFTALGSEEWPTSLRQRTPYLTYYIYNYSLSDSSQEKHLAWAGALVLLVLVMLLNVGIRALTGKRVLSATRAD